VSNLEVDARALAELRGTSLDRRQLVDRRGGEREVMGDEARDLRADDPAEHQHRCAHAFHAAGRTPSSKYATPRYGAPACSSFLATATRPCPYAFAFKIGITSAGATCWRMTRKVLGEHGEIDLQVRGSELVVGEGRLVQWIHPAQGESHWHVR